MEFISQEQGGIHEQYTGIVLNSNCTEGVIYLFLSVIFFSFVLNKAMSDQLM